jgi:hypothetical protein
MVGGLNAGAIKQAKAMRDWAMGEQAIEELIAMQGAFVAWWDATVTPGQHANQYMVVPETGRPLSLVDATAQTGISKQQVSR